MEDTSSPSAIPLALGYPLLGPSRHARRYCCMRYSPALAFSAVIYFTMKRSSPCSVVLHHSLPSPWTAVVFYWSAVMPKALMSSRKIPHPLFFLTPYTARATNCPNTTHFSSLVSSMRATNPANRISLFRKVVLLTSHPGLMSVAR